MLDAELSAACVHQARARTSVFRLRSHPPLPKILAAKVDRMEPAGATLTTYPLLEVSPHVVATVP